MSDAAQDDVDDVWGAALAEQGGVITDAQPAPMRNLDADVAAANLPPGSLDNILEIPVMLTVEIGSTKVAIRNLLQLNQGSVVELDRLAGEPLDVLVNGTLIAHGEVVVVNEKFGIRLTDVISAHERVRKLS
ncbi:MAG: flagellar motor switch protein FliN [Proteobacteria bacterium]|jgi:flagellar motor switch protein FliN/FliY|nr:flagellar motor switch protein FliN [Pseudomonadota bacterium]